MARIPPNKMNSLQLQLLILLGFVFSSNLHVTGESLTCLAVYKEGGAPAVFRSPECPRWKLSDYQSSQRSTKSSRQARCQSAIHQGHRKTQEDRTLCALDIRIPFPGPGGIKEVTVGIIGVFDGHNGAWASDMASKLLLDYFSLHTYFLLDTIFSILSGKFVPMLPDGEGQGQFFQEFNWEEWDQYPFNLGRLKLKLSTILDGSFHLEVLREALVRAIHDIDVAVSIDAFGDKFDSGGSTATVILTADSHFLVVNIGDSKAFLCSEVDQPPREARATMLRLYRQKRSGGSFPLVKDYSSLKIAAASGWKTLIARDLTNDHHPDRDDERLRVESSGGYISENGGVARVNGQLAVSRAIGDVYFKSYGVTSLPEVNDWQLLTMNDSYLVASTDGLFENMNSQDMCDILWQLDSDVFEDTEIPYPCTSSFADCLVNTAIEKGSTDNLACVILPVKSMAISEASEENDCRELECSILEYQDPINEESELLRLDHTYANPVLAKFDRLLIERKQCSFGCFYLSENLNEADDTFWVLKDYEHHNYDFPQALPSAVAYTFGGQLDRYSEQNMCMLLGVDGDLNSDQCTNPEGFARFLGFLGSIPLHDTGSEEHMNMDSRYILKKRYDRGAYGEVWLAFMWNCSGMSGNFEESCQNRKYRRPVHPEASSFAEEHNDNIPPDGDMFILKRIKVEKGAAFYLSGLREKYFGELFLNASTLLGGFSSAGSFSSLFKPQSDNFYNMNSNKSIHRKNKNRWSSEEDVSSWKGLNEDGLDHIVRFVEYFESRTGDIWLVFRHEGLSLWKLLYTAEMVNNVDDEKYFKRVQILHPSKWWHWLKTTAAGQEEMRSLIWQLLVALKSCHDRNITHRDIKPENMVICIEDQTSGRCLKGHPMGDKNYTAKLRIIDFGSALDEFTMKHLYGSTGPSRAEQTSEYTPPEGFLNASWYQGPKNTVVKYDVWSVGVVILELILGSPNVFQINAKTRALLDQHLEGWNESLKELAYRLRAFMEMCILLPGISTRHQYTTGTNGKGSYAPVPWKCSEEYFSNQIKSRDPLKLGFPNIWALRLVRELLHWNPEERLTVEEALRHPYFSQSFQEQQTYRKKEA